MTMEMTPRIKPAGNVKKRNHGAAAAAQFPSFAGCGHARDPSNPMTIGEQAIANATNPTKQPGFRPPFSGALTVGVVS